MTSVDPKELLIAMVTRQPDVPVLIAGDHIVTHRQFLTLVEHAEAKLDQLGVTPGSTVGVVLPNSLELLVLTHAILWRKAIVFPIAPTVTPAELTQLVGPTTLALCIVPPFLSSLTATSFAAKVVQVTTDYASLDLIVVTSDSTLVPSLVAPFSAGNPYVVRLVSSGTSGAYKQVLHTAAALFAMGANLTTAYHYRIGAERAMMLVPPSHLIGFGYLMSPIYFGWTNIITNGFVPQQFIAELQHHRATLLFATPFIFETLAKVAPADLDLSHLQKAVSSGGPLSEAVYRSFTSRCRASLHIMYGSTEATIVTARIDDGNYSGTDVGKPVADMIVKVFDDQKNELPTGSVGNVAVSGPTVISGYFNNDRANVELFVNNFLLMGDRGFLDATGNLHIVGRTNLVISVGGLKVDIMEVEAVLAGHPSVAEALVYGVSQASTEVVKAAVVCTDTTLTTEALMQHCRDHLSDYKVPKEIIFVPQLPRSATGKVVRGDVAALLSKK